MISPTCPSWCTTDDHHGEVDNEGVYNFEHHTYLMREWGADITLGYAETVPPVDPGEWPGAGVPSLWVDIQRQDVTQADLRRWSAALLEAADFMERG